MSYPMMFFLLFLDAACDNGEPTIMARPPGAPYVFYKQEIQSEDKTKDEESESAALSQEHQNVLEEQNDEKQELQS